MSQFFVKSILMNNSNVKIPVLLVLLSLAVFGVPAWAQNFGELTLDRAISLAIRDDDWLVANVQTERSFSEESISAGQLPDPRMTVGLANMPLDTFRFNQEPMTQFRVGISQSFPRGDSLALQQRQKIQQSEVNPYLRDDRMASVALDVSNRWLDSYLAERSIALIDADRSLFEQLVDLTSVRYTTASGLARQQDLIRAELELTRLDDRLAMLRQQQDTGKQGLLQWLPYEVISIPFPAQLPDIEAPTEVLDSLAEATAFFANHPRVRAHDKQIEVARTEVELAEQSLKPAYSIGASYGYRDSAPMGIERADFLSLDFSFDLPLFSEKRQRPQIRASRYRAEARQTERTLILRELFSNYQRAIARLEILNQRQALFNDTLLSQLNDLTEATLSAYTADEGDFEEVMRAYIGELNAKVELLQIDVERLKILSNINYLLTTSVN